MRFHRPQDVHRTLNEVASDNFALFLYLILRGPLDWFWWKHRPWEFHYRSICHHSLLYHYHTTFVRGVQHHFYPLPLSFFLRVLPKRHMLGVWFTSLSTFLLIIVSVWHFLPSDLVIFYSTANKHVASGDAFNALVNAVIVYPTGVLVCPFISSSVTAGLGDFVLTFELRKKRSDLIDCPRDQTCFLAWGIWSVSLPTHCLFD